MLPTPIFRRIGAMTYDFLLHAALWMTVTLIFNAIVLKGQELDDEYRYILWFTLFPLYVLSSFSFVSYFWRKNQQTLGMQAWRLKIVNKEGKTPSMAQIAIRFAIGFVTLGAGIIWCLFDREKRSLQDVLSPTNIVYIPKSI